MIVFYRHYDSPLGKVFLASDGEALTGLWFEGRRHFTLLPEKRGEETILPVLEETCRWLDTYFNGQVPDFTPALRLQGSPFRRAVWQLLLEIPYGQTVSYGRLAARVARILGCGRMSAQAVGGAVGHNPVSLIVPCHRVIGTDGSLVGYAGGLELKARLLSLEQKNIVG